MRYIPLIYCLFFSIFFTNYGCYRPCFNQIVYYRKVDYSKSSETTGSSSETDNVRSSSRLPNSNQDFNVLKISNLKVTFYLLFLA